MVSRLPMTPLSLVPNCFVLNNEAVRNYARIILIVSQMSPPLPSRTHSLTLLGKHSAPELKLQPFKNFICL